MKQYIFSFLDQNFLIKTEKEYNQMLGKVIKIIQQQKQLKKNYPIFKKEIKLINKKVALSESTVWGGVNLKKVDVEKNFIRKLLVVKQWGILGFEIHKEKIEKLKILEGQCLVMKSKGKEIISLVKAKPGDKFKYLPGEEHGVIALTDCVIQEESTNHLDDLIFLYNSKQII